MAFFYLKKYCNYDVICYTFVLMKIENIDKAQQLFYNKRQTEIGLLIAQESTSLKDIDESFDRAKMEYNLSDFTNVKEIAIEKLTQSLLIINSEIEQL